MAVVVISEAWVTINQWQGTGWAAIDPYTGLGAYIIAGGDHSDELGEWLHLSNVTKREAAKQVVISLIAPPAVPVSYLAVLASIQEFGIASLTLGGMIGIGPITLAIILLMLPLALYFSYVVIPPAEIWYDPDGEVYIGGGGYESKKDS